MLSFFIVVLISLVLTLLQQGINELIVNNAAVLVDVKSAEKRKGLALVHVDA